MNKGILTILVKIVILALLTHAAIFIFKLGWFVIIVWALGGIISVVITKSEWNVVGRMKLISPILIAALYLFVIYSSWNLFTDRKHRQTFSMSWNDKGNVNQYNESEVVLHFQDFPEQYIGIFSNDVANYLKNHTYNNLLVTFEVTSDFGCMRGFHEVQIGDLHHWKSAWGYGSITESASPWGKSNWWCS